MRDMAPRPTRILVGYDGSEASQRALDGAADLVGYGSSLAVVHVRPAGARGVGVVERARERLLRRQIRARYLQPFGDPARQIVEAALTVGADLIVAGRRNALERLFGSVSAGVLECAPCNVLVVR